MFGLSKKKSRQGPLRPRPKPRPRSEFAARVKDIADMNPQLKDIHFGPDVENAVWDEDDHTVNWVGTFSLFMGEMRSYFLYRHVEYVVRVTDFSGTLTRLFDITTKAQAAVIADVENLTAKTQASGDVQFRVGDEPVTITVSVKPLLLSTAVSKGD